MVRLFIIYTIVTFVREKPYFGIYVCITSWIILSSHILLEISNFNFKFYARLGNFKMIFIIFTVLFF